MFFWYYVHKRLLFRASLHIVPCGATFRSPWCQVYLVDDVNGWIGFNGLRALVI